MNNISIHIVIAWKKIDQFHPIMGNNQYINEKTIYSIERYHIDKFPFMASQF